MINRNDKHREQRRLISRHSLGNGKSDCGWLTYHCDRFKFRIRTKNGLNYTVPSQVHRWINVGNNVITAPPLEVAHG